VRYKKNINLWIVAFELGMMALMIIVELIVLHYSGSLQQQEKNRFEMTEAANLLKQSSHMLTHFSRLFVVTNEPEYKKDYLEILKIRQGKEARPKNYNDLYWLLGSKDRSDRHPQTYRNSIKDIITFLPYTKEERGLLLEAKDHSDSLVGMEIDAFSLMGTREGQQKAISMLHSKEYNDKMRLIAEPLDKFLMLLEERLGNEAKDIREKITNNNKVMFALIILFVLSNSALFFFLERQKEMLKTKELLLQKQSRLAQMGEMISMIAHQWRQPLSAIATVSASMEINAELGRSNNEQIIEQTRKIASYINYLSTTINDFRDFFKPDKAKELVSFNTLINATLAMIDSSLKKNNITVIQKLDDEVEFMTFANEVKQVLLNLLKNAEDALVLKRVENPTIMILTYNEPDHLNLIVRDNAGGVPVEIIRKIFDPYFSTKDNKNGTGIGLYMSRSIIEEHCGGELTVENQRDGAAFKIRLPKSHRSDENS